MNRPTDNRASAGINCYRKRTRAEASPKPLIVSKLDMSKGQSPYRSGRSLRDRWLRWVWRRTR